MRKLNAIKGHTYRPSRPNFNWEFKKSKAKRLKRVAENKATFITPKQPEPCTIQGAQTLESMGLNLTTAFTVRHINITGV